jgi:hypothetical protein
VAITVAPGSVPLLLSVIFPLMLDVVTWAIKLMEAIIATKKVSNFFIDNNLMLIIKLI